MELLQNKVVLIDIDEVVRKRTGGKKVPGLLIRWLKRFVHQEDFNGFFKEGKLGTEFLEGFLKYMNVDITVVGAENIPAQGRFTFASNHPLGGVDTCAEAGFLARRYDGKLSIPANDFIMNVKQVQEYLIPVNKLGGQPRELAARLDEAFASDRQILFFPSGKCSREIDGKIQDPVWMKTFITKSRRSRRDIIPIWFSGQNSKRFYAINRWCKRLGIKTNLAMFFLPSEVFRCRNKHYTMVIGKPIPWQNFTSEKTDPEWAAWVREQVYRLQDTVSI